MQLLVIYNHHKPRKILSLINFRIKGRYRDRKLETGIDKKLFLTNQGKLNEELNKIKLKLNLFLYYLHKVYISNKITTTMNYKCFLRHQTAAFWS